MKDQLENLVEQMYSTGILYSEGVREFQKRFISNVLKQKRGNQVAAALELGMHRNTLSRTIRDLKIDGNQFRANRRYQARKPNQPAVLAAAAGARLG